MTDVASHYLDEIKRQLRGHKRMAEAAMAQLEDKDFFATIDPESNSIGMLIKHMAGNARSRFTDFLTSDGEKPERYRDREFEISTTTARAEVMHWWEEGWAIVFSTLEELEPEIEEASASLGANRWQTARRVLFPEILPPLLTGFALAFARALVAP